MKPAASRQTLGISELPLFALRLKLGVLSELGSKLRAELQVLKKGVAPRFSRLSSARTVDSSLRSRQSTLPATCSWG